MKFKRFGNNFIDTDRITEVEVVETDFGPNGIEQYLKVTLDDDVCITMGKFEAQADPFFKQFFTNRIVTVQ